MIRDAGPADLAFLMRADLEGSPGCMTARERRDHAAKIGAFTSMSQDVAYLYEEGEDACGAILVRFRDPAHEAPTPANRLLLERVFPEIDSKWLPADGRFAEVFNLWVEPPCRRRGIASALKRHFEAEARRRGVGLLYTHTEHPHVVALNEALGYVVVRRGPIWDDVPRISLVKALVPVGTSADRPG